MPTKLVTLLTLTSLLVAALLQLGCKDDDTRKVFPAMEGYRKLIISGTAQNKDKSISDTPTIFVFRAKEFQEVARYRMDSSKFEKGQNDFQIDVWLPNDFIQSDILALDTELRPGKWATVEGRNEKLWIISLPGPNCSIAESVLREDFNYTKPSWITFEQSKKDDESFFVFYPSNRDDPYPGDSRSLVNNFDHGRFWESRAEERASNVISYRTQMESKIAPAKTPPMYSNIIMRVLLSIASFLIGFGLMWHFFKEIFPQEKNSDSLEFLSRGTALCLSGLFAVWVFNATEADQLISQVTKGLFGVIGSVIGILFLFITGYLAVKKMKATVNSKSEN